MANSWIPGWAGIGWTVAYGLLLPLHLGHVVVMRGRTRLWHIAHMLMALGMIDMFWRRDVLRVGARTGQVIFAGAAAALLILVVRDLLRRIPVHKLWLIAVVDLMAMSYMYVLTARSARALTVALAAWLAFESLGWATGYFGQPVRVGVALRASLVVMSLGMAYALLAMRFGMADGGMPPGMHDGGMHHM